MKCGVRWALFVICLSACSHKSSESSLSSGRVSPTYDGPPETDYCATTVSYSDSVTITGVATYNRREPYYVNNVTSGLGGSELTSTHPATNHPIRRAEVRVTDPAGNVVQCSTTDDSGNISFSLPRGNVSYKVSINSRAYNAFLKASVLNAPEQNLFYSLTTTVTATASTNFGTLTATANGDLLGGAFNILDQLYNANAYLRAQVGSCSTNFAGCKDVNLTSTIGKVSAYWEKGFNPNSYFGSTSGLSFYLPGYSRLFILGGVDGVVDTADTDHFDNSVIVHEYGHFLEDTVGNSDSPGGSHNGNKVIDPRLAWSEGWGNFFQAAVIDSDAAAAAIYDGHYIDTIGNDDGDTDMAFYVGLETAVSGYDYPLNQGEGNFREFSVTRLLWDVIDNTPTESQFGGLDDVSNKFPEIWAAFSSTLHGFKNSAYSFRSVSLLHLIQEYFHSVDTHSATADWSNVRLNERHDGNEGHYAQYVTTSGCTSGSYVSTGSVAGNHYYFATGSSFASDNGSLSNSNQFLNNSFFRFIAPSNGTHTLKMIYQDADGSAVEADLDFYVYNDNYTFSHTSDMVGYSRQDPISATTIETEAVSGTLSGGANYLLNVNVYTGSALGTQAYFNLYYDGSLLCPANIVQ
jgi:hypothetical protein